MKLLKNTFKVIVALLLVATATSCKKEYITEEYYTQGSQIFTYEYTVKASDWQQGDYFGTRPYWYAIVDDDDITNQVMDNGAVLGYLWNVYDNNGNASWNTLPYVYSYVTSDDDGNDITVAENIRFEYENGIATFVIEDLDGVLPEAYPDDLTFKIVVVKD